MRLSLLAPSIFALSLVAVVGPSSAAGPDAKAAARALADKGYERYEAGQYDAAIDFFRRADDLYHAPTLVYAQAKASAKAGKLIEARALYRKVGSEKLPSNAPDEFVGAQDSAKKEAAALDPRIPTLTIQVIAAAGLHFSVSIDGARLSPSSLDKAVEQNPGEHAILVMPETGRGVGRHVVLREGDRERVEIKLAGAGARREAPPPPPSPVAPVAPVAPRNPRLTPALVSFGVGAVGLGLGGAMGATTLSRAADLEAQCPSHKGCAASLVPGYTTTNTLATLSTVGFAVGGAGVLTGVILLALPSKKEGAATPAALSVGPGSIGLKGTF